MSYIAAEDVAKAKEMDLLTYLRNYEPQELVHVSGNTYCTREHDSLRISNGKWCWFSQGIGGRSALDYLIKVKGMNDREVNPEKYIAPKNWYKYGSEMVRPYKIRIHPPCTKDEKKLRRYYESKLAALPDVMDVAAVVDFTGYNRRTVCQWIRVGKLKALALLQKYMIPKCYLIDWLCSDDYNNTNRQSRRHIDMLWEAQKWRD